MMLLYSFPDGNMFCCSYFCSQDWKEKYIHKNYTHIFTQNVMEQVSLSGPWSRMCYLRCSEGYLVMFEMFSVLPGYVSVQCVIWL